MDNTPMYSIPEEEFSLNDYIRSAKEYLLYFWVHKWYILLVSIAGASYFAWQAYRKPTIYTAELTFMISEDNGQSTVYSILGEFGLTNSSNSEYNLEKILTLGKSRRIIQTVLFERLKWQQQEDYLANHLIDYFELPKVWAKSGKSELVDFRFSRDSITASDRNEASVLKTLHNRLVGKTGLVKIDYDKVTTILNIKTHCEDENLAKFLTESLYAKLSQYYIEKSTEKQQFTVNVFQNRSDSILNALSQAEYQLAYLQDNSRGFQLQKDRLRQNRLQRKVQVLTVAYGENLKNLETSNFLLENETPFFQMIDPPLSPLSYVEGNYLMGGIKGGLIGGSIVVLILAGIKYLRIQLKEKI